MIAHVKNLALLVICISGFQSSTYSQTTYSVKETEQMDIRLFGTSTLHDWEMSAQHTTGQAEFEFKAGNRNDLTSINSLSFSLHVADLKSDNKQLDNNAYKALKSDVYKDIRYQLVSSSITSAQSGFLIKSKGNLTIAGVTNTIDLEVHCVINADGTVTSKGTYQLKMTDFDVVPPSFMWGAMKTGDGLKLEFVVVYQATKEP